MTGSCTPWTNIYFHPRMFDNWPVSLWLSVLLLWNRYQISQGEILYKHSTVHVLWDVQNTFLEPVSVWKTHSSYHKQRVHSLSCGKIAQAGNFVKHKWFTSYWATSTSKDDGSVDDSSHCEAARAESDYMLAKASTWPPKSCLLISGCDDPLWAVSVKASPQY